MAQPTLAIIIGAGPSGISLAYHLKQRLGVDDFVCFDQAAGIGGTWYLNDYPGCGCDVPSHFYSFSFNLNPYWSKPLAERAEILEYMNATVDKFLLRPHFILSTMCTGATWNQDTSTWTVRLKNVQTEHEYTREARVFISGTGFFSRPKFPEIEGMDTFEGASWHVARWNSKYNLQNKKIAVIGNGCSGSQLIPAIAPEAKRIIHYARSKQWLFERPNMPYSAFDQFLFANVPGLMRWTRFMIYYGADKGWLEYVDRPGSEQLRKVSEKMAFDYMMEHAPAKYAKDLIPDYQVGCKRRVFDPGYLKALHRKNVELEQGKIARIDHRGVVMEDGKRQDFDVILYATGYSTQNFLAPMLVVGQGGKSLNEHWEETGGCQAYCGTTVSGFPNMAIIFGPNAAPAHNSTIFNIEVQVEYVIKTLFEPLLSGRAESITVKRTAEDYDVNVVQQGLKGSVWTNGGCVSWSINKSGRNTASYPDYVRHFWWKLSSPKFEDYILEGEKPGWRIRHARLKLKQYLPSLLGFAVVGSAFVGATYSGTQGALAKLSQLMTIRV